MARGDIMHTDVWNPRDVSDHRPKIYFYKLNSWMNKTVTVRWHFSSQFITYLNANNNNNKQHWGG